MNLKRSPFQLVGYIYVLLAFIFINDVSAQYDSIPWDGLQRHYLVHLPEGYTGDEQLPLVIVMHGGGGNAVNIQEQSGFSIEADEGNFIVVYPEGAPSVFNIRTWNAGNCCSYAMNNNIDDVGFINALLDHLISEFSIDSNRIYASGMSNGGMMAYRLACEISERIAAIGPVATTLVVNECDPARPVPAIIFHSLLDEIVPYEGGMTTGLSNHYNPPQDSVMTVWAQKNSCAELSEIVVESDEYVFLQFGECDCLSEVQHYTTSDGGHSWPGGVATPIGDPVSEHLDATDLIWDFFLNHTLECNVVGGVGQKDVNQWVDIYPNPSDGVFNVLISEGAILVDIKMYSLDGKLIELESVGNTLDFSGLNDGVYLLKVTTNKGVAIKRVVRKK